MIKKLYIRKQDSTLTLWVSYAINNGTTFVLKEKSFITNKKEDSHYTFLFNEIEILLWNYEVKKQVYEIPVYNNPWLAPIGKIYFTLRGSSIKTIDWFCNKKEALSWVKL